MLNIAGFYNELLGDEIKRIVAKIAQAVLAGQVRVEKNKCNDNEYLVRMEGLVFCVDWRYRFSSLQPPYVMTVCRDNASLWPIASGNEQAAWLELEGLHKLLSEHANRGPVAARPAEDSEDVKKLKKFLGG